MSDLLSYDYSRSFAQWWDNHAHHSPRCAIHASCKLREKDGSTREYFLTHPCAGEKMYADRDIVHVPVADFHMICESEQQYLIVKVYAGEPIELRMDHRLGEVVATHDKRGAIIMRLEVTMRRFPGVRPLRSDREVYEAMVANLPILARTSFTADDGQTQVISEFPVTVMNARHGDHRWQVDTGPILVPDYSLKPRLPVGLFRQAYIVFNSWDWAEVTLRQPIEGRTMHYGPPRRIAAKNELFAADV